MAGRGHFRGQGAYQSPEPLLLRVRRPQTDGEWWPSSAPPGLYCYDFTGKELWHRSLGEIDSWHGSGSSPVIHRGLCYLNFGPGTQAALYALDVNSGEIVWKVPPRVSSPFGGLLKGLSGVPRSGQPPSG